MSLARYFSFFLLFALQLLWSFSRAAQQNFLCYAPDQKGVVASGGPLETPEILASVSKVFTSYWAVSRLGPEGRFESKFYLSDLGNGTYNLHIEGGHDPLAGRSLLQFVVGELNREGVNEIDQLTFDENFKFFADVRGSSVAQAHLGPQDPGPQRVQKELQEALSSLTKDYDQLQERAQSVAEMILPASLELKVQRVDFLTKAQFSPPTQAKVYVYRSAPLVVLLKEMNRNSNNYVAEQIFESLGGHGAFADFMKTKLGFTTKDVHLINGSGDRSDEKIDGIIYNQATCQALLTTLQDFQSALELNGNYSLEDVLALVGEDAPGDDPSTISRLYKNDITDHAMLAKTGTVNPAVSLAGVLSTVQGRVFFGTVYKTNGSSADSINGRSKILHDLPVLYQKFGGPRKISYTATPFLPFRADSWMMPETLLAQP